MPRRRKDPEEPRRAPRQSVQDAFLLGDVTTQAGGWRLQLIRSMEGQTREEFAPRIGMRASNLHSVESGKSYLRPKYAKLLYEEFDIDFDFIYYGDPRHLTVDIAVRLLNAADDLPPPRDHSGDAD